MANSMAIMNQTSISLVYVWPLYQLTLTFRAFYWLLLASYVHLHNI